MALTKCKECGKEVSSLADICPHCGIKEPGVIAASNLPEGTIIGTEVVQPKSFGCFTSSIIITIGSAFIIALIANFNGNSSQSDSNNGSVAKSKHSSDNCRNDLKCLAKENIVDAAIDCRIHIEKLSQFSSRWTTDKSFERFSHFRWLDKDNATLTFIGDKIEFQNGFGAYQPHTYECDYEPASKAVLAVRARAGRL